MIAILVIIIIILFTISSSCGINIIEKMTSKTDLLLPLKQLDMNSGFEGGVGNKINLINGGVYKKLLKGHHFQSVIFETNATHNLFIFVGHVKEDQDGYGYIKNPATNTYKRVANFTPNKNINYSYSYDHLMLNNKTLKENMDGDELTGINDGNIGYEISICEKLNTENKYYIRHINDIRLPKAIFSKFQTLIADNSLQNLMNSVCDVYCGDNDIIEIDFDNNGSLIRRTFDKNNKEISTTGNKDVFKYMLETDKQYNTIRFSPEIYKKDIKSVTKSYNIPNDIRNPNRKIIPDDSIYRTINKYGYIPHNFNLDPFILSSKSNRACDNKCDSTCISLRINIELDIENVLQDTKPYVGEINNLMVNIENTHILYMKNGLNVVAYQRPIKMFGVYPYLHPTGIYYYETDIKLKELSSEEMTKNNYGIRYKPKLIAGSGFDRNDGSGNYAYCIKLKPDQHIKLDSDSALDPDHKFIEISVVLDDLKEFNRTFQINDELEGKHVDELPTAKSYKKHLESIGSDKLAEQYIHLFDPTLEFEQNIIFKLKFPLSFNDMEYIKTRDYDGPNKIIIYNKEFKNRITESNILDFVNKELSNIIMKKEREDMTKLFSKYNTTKNNMDLLDNTTLNKIVEHIKNDITNEFNTSVKSYLINILNKCHVKTKYVKARFKGKFTNTLIEIVGINRDTEKISRMNYKIDSNNNFEKDLLGGFNEMIKRNECMEYLVYESLNNRKEKPQPVFIEVTNVATYNAGKKTYKMKSNQYHIQQILSYNNTDIKDAISRTIVYDIKIPTNSTVNGHLLDRNIEKISTAFKTSLKNIQQEYIDNANRSSDLVIQRVTIEKLDRNYGTQVPDLDENKKKYIKIDINHDYNVITVYKCNDSNGNNAHVVATHGLSEVFSIDNKLNYYPGLWVGYKNMDVRDGQEIRNYINKDFRKLITSNDDVYIKMVKIDYYNNTPTWDESSRKIIKDKFIYEIGKCPFNSIKTEIPFSPSSCIKKCDMELECKGIEINYKENTLQNMLSKVVTEPVCNLLTPTDFNDFSLTAGNSIVTSDDSSNVNNKPKYFKNITSSDVCFMKKRDYKSEIQKDKIDSIVEFVYKPIAIQHRLLKIDTNEEYIPSWFKCNYNGVEVTCNTNALDILKKKVKKVIDKLIDCQKYGICAELNFSDNNINYIIVDDIEDIKNKVNNKTIAQQESEVINTIYFTKTPPGVYTVLPSIGRVKDLNIIKILFTTNKNVDLTIIHLFQYALCGSCENADIQSMKDENKKTIELNKVKERILSNNDLGNRFCEIPEIILDDTDNKLHQRFIKVFSDIDFEGISLDIKTSGSVHIFIGNMNETDMTSVPSSKYPMKFGSDNVYKECIMPKMSKGVQISLDTFLSNYKGIGDRFGATALYKYEDSYTYDSLHENVEIKDFIGKTGRTSRTGMPLMSLSGLEFEKTKEHFTDIVADDNNGVFGKFYNIIIDIDKIEGRINVLYKLPLTETDYMLLMSFEYTFYENYKLYVVSTPISTALNNKTVIKPSIYRFDSTINTDDFIIKDNIGGEACLKDIITHKQNTKLVTHMFSNKPSIPNYTLIGSGKCVSIDNTIPPEYLIKLTYNPKTGEDIDFKSNESIMKACAAYCDAPDYGINEDNNCIGFNTTKSESGDVYCTLYGNLNNMYENKAITPIYDFSHNSPYKVRPKGDVVNRIAKTVRHSCELTNECSGYESILDLAANNKLCYANENANLITQQEYDRVKQEKLNEELEEIQRKQHNELERIRKKREEIRKTIEPKPCDNTKMIPMYSNCLCPEGQIKYRFRYGYDGKLKGDSFSECINPSDVPEICENSIDPRCECPPGKEKYYRNGYYSCKLPNTIPTTWSECIMEGDDASTGMQYYSNDIKVPSQGSGVSCDSGSSKRERKCTPKDLPIGYWKKALMEEGCEPYWFEEAEGIEFYNNNYKDKTYNWIKNWAKQKRLEGSSICKSKWGGKMGQCIAMWDKDIKTSKKYMCHTDTGICKVEDVNIIQGNTDPEIIDLIFDSKQNCEVKCPDITRAFFNDVSTSLNYTDNDKNEINTKWFQGNCKGIADGGKRNIYYMCEKEKGKGYYGVKPVLFTETRFKEDINLKDYVFETYEEALEKCTDYPPEYNGELVNIYDHISYSAVINEFINDDNKMTFPKEYNNKDMDGIEFSKHVKKYHANNSLIPHMEMYGEKDKWFDEYKRFMTREPTVVFDPSNKKCIHSLIDLNKYQSPRMHYNDFLESGYPETCGDIQQSYKNLNELKSKTDVEVGDIFLITSINKLYEVIYNKNYDKNEDIVNNDSKIKNIWGNNNYYALKEIQNNKCENGKGSEIRHISKLNFDIEWDDKDPATTFSGYACKGGQLSQEYKAIDCNVTSLYNCAIQCREHNECKYFTYYKGIGSGYFKGNGPASIYPSNSYPKTYHGSIFGGEITKACEEFYNPFSKFNNTHYNEHPTLFGFYRRGKKHLSKREATDMGCTWFTGPIDNDTHIEPIALMTELDNTITNDIRIEIGSIPGTEHIPHDLITIDNDGKKYLVFPKYFLNNNSFDFLTDYNVSFPKKLTDEYKLLTKTHDYDISTLKTRLDNQRNEMNKQKIVMDQKKALYNADKKSEKYKIYQDEYIKFIRLQELFYMTNGEYERKKANIDDAFHKLKSLKRDIVRYNTRLFNAIPAGNNSPFQKYKKSSSNEKDNNSPCLKYLIPPMLIKENIALYPYVQNVKAQVNKLNISCDNLMNRQDRLKSSKASCKNNPLLSCDTDDIFKDTNDYKPYIHRLWKDKYSQDEWKDDIQYDQHWSEISRNESEGEIRNKPGRCKLFNYSTSEPTYKINTQRKPVSGILTDRDKYTGKKISEKIFTDKHSAENEKMYGATVKQINDKYLIMR